MELRRLARSRFVRAIGLASLCGPLFGYAFFTMTNTSVTNGRYIANPVLVGTVVSAILWAVLTFLESDRVYRAKADVLTDTVMSPVRIVAMRVFALITLSTAATILCALLYLPYSMIKINDLFDGGLYALSFLILMLPTVWISILLAAAFYQITRRIELAGLLYAGMVYFSFSPYVARDFFSRWLNPLFVDYSYSDGFTNAPTLRIAFYTRMLWLALSAGAWVLSLLCIRRYQKGLIGSFLLGVRKIYLPLISAALICTGFFLWAQQPFVNHGPEEFVDTYAHTARPVSTFAKKATYDITAHPSGDVSGLITYTMRKITDSESPESLWLNSGYQISSITCDGEEIHFTTLENDINDRRETTFALPIRAKMTVIIRYRGMPQMLRCFSPGSWQTQSTPGYFALSNASSGPCFTSFSLPDEATLNITMKEEFTPILDHVVLTDFTQNPDHTKTWTATFNGWGFWLTACDYGSKEFQTAGCTVNLLYSRKYEKIINDFEIPQAIADVMDYCTAHFGSLPFITGGKLMMVQRGGNGGGNAGGGWVEWDESIFSEMNLSDPLKGSSASEVFAHEIIHEWWGGLGVYSGQDGLWSDEGLTVYTTYRLMKEKYGTLYAKENYIDVWEAAVNEQNRGYYYRHPEMLSKLPANYQAELNQRAEQINYYCRMPLMLLRAAQLVGGEERMDEILRSIQRQHSQAPDKYDKPFTYQMFLAACGLKAEDLQLE